MRVVIVADTFPPLRTSGAVQLRDLTREFAAQGHEPTVIVPSSDLNVPWKIERVNGTIVMRCRTPGTKDIGYVRRTINEMRLPYLLLRALRASELSRAHWDGVVWYAPSIFLGPIVRVLRRENRCRSYLILRDIFPEWAVNMGLMRRGSAYWFFKLVERYQYSVADTVGVQSPSNLGYLAEWAKKPGRCLEVLQNWLAPAPNVGSSVSVAATPLFGRTIFVYAGNMGVAQGMDILLDLAERLKNRQDIGFMFVGRGSEVPRLRTGAEQRALDNIVFRDEVDPCEIPGLLAQCHIGLVALDPRHKTHNVPGKFLTYMQAGLPVLARINSGNDLADLINREGVGRVYIGESLDALEALAVGLVDDKAGRELMSSRGRALAKSLFSPTAAVRQVVAALSNNA